LVFLLYFYLEIGSVRLTWGAEGDSCCKNVGQYVVTYKSGYCIGPRNTDLPLDAYYQCNEEGLVCDINTQTCVDENSDPPDDVTCGYENMSCCFDSSLRTFSCSRSSLRCDITTHQCVLINNDEIDDQDKDVYITPKDCTTDGGEQGLMTALGCVPYESGGLVAWLLRYGISIGGGIAFLLMVWGAFLLTTSNGDQEKVKQGREIITSAIAGLLFIIFSVYLLSLVGIQILKIPGFEN
jgi:hypothetical protein